eukprot:3465224-Rhodomonas_salina.4
MRCPVPTWRMRLRACYAMSGTEIAYPVPCPVNSAIRLRACYAISGTDVAYGPTRLLCDVRY